MKSLILAAVLLTGTAFAQTAPLKPKVYRPFVYETPCILEAGLQTYPDVCKVAVTVESFVDKLQLEYPN